MQKRRIFAKEAHPSGCGDLPTWLNMTKHARKKRTPDIAGETFGGPRRATLDVPPASPVSGATPSTLARPPRMYFRVDVLGSSLSCTMRTTAGTLYGARPAVLICSRMAFMSTRPCGSRSVGAAGERTIATPGSSPHSSDSTTKHTASWNHACATSASSISYGDTCSPPRLMSSFDRPLMVKWPSASSTPLSPVMKNQSSSSFVAPPAHESRKKFATSASGFSR
mmetsp:Transcript_44825/g.144626  ORF Transcript_44825/g.144626 Transcript_44825/m.144626 type:complete len:224 (-) Transcript_44825:523-1194(-)